MTLAKNLVEKNSIHPQAGYMRQTLMYNRKNDLFTQASTKDTGWSRRMIDTDKRDKQLLNRIQTRDSVALQELYDQHAPKTYNLIMHIVRDSGMAEELLQETFWQVWKKADNYRGSGAVAAWLYRIARNKSLDALRRQKARPQLATDQEPQDVVNHHTSRTTVETQVSHQLDKQQLHQALAKIPQEQRYCLELAYFSNMSQRQIAAYTNTSLGTVKTRMRLGLEKLERILRAGGYKEEDVL